MYSNFSDAEVWMRPVLAVAIAGMGGVIVEDSVYLWCRSGLITCSLECMRKIWDRSETMKKEG